jgi:predicted MFS family arabinose efflux permease
MPSTPHHEGEPTCSSASASPTTTVIRPSRRAALDRLRGAASPLAPFRIALRERELRRLLAGVAASEAGDWLYSLALLALVYERTGSSTWLGMTTAARMLPWVVFGPLGGVLADRIDRRLLMIGSDFLRAACMAALTVVAVVGGPVVLIPALAALCTAAGAAYSPCVVAVLPQLVPDDRLPAANAARVSLTHLAVVAGPVIGAGLLLAGSAAVAFAVNGVTFLLGAAVVASLPRHALGRPAGDDRAPATLRSELRGGWSALRGHPGALALVGASVVDSAIYGALTVLFVLIGARLGLGDGGYGLLLAAVGAGGVLSGGLASRAAASDDPRRVLLVAMVAVGAPIPLFALLGWVVPALVLAAFFGAGTLVGEVVVDTYLQRSLDPAVFASAYGLALPAALAGIVAGALVTPPCLSLVGLDGTLALFGAIALAYAALVLARPGQTLRLR